MLPSKNRLKLNKQNSGNKDFTKTSIVTDELVLVYKRLRKTVDGAGREPSELKAATIVSKKTAPKAVDRNRIKRVLAEVLKEHLKLGGELKVIVKKNIAGQKVAQVQAKMTKLLQKLQ